MQALRLSLMQAPPPPPLLGKVALCSRTPLLEILLPPTKRKPFRRFLTLLFQTSRAARTKPVQVPRLKKVKSSKGSSVVASRSALVLRRRRAPKGAAGMHLFGYHAVVKLLPTSVPLSYVPGSNQGF